MYIIMPNKNLLADEQAANIFFVEEVEKYPCLYNFKLSDYSKRDIVDAAWENVAKAVNDTVTNCKEKWRNLRTVFVRKQKLPPSGSGRKNSKPYYLNEMMQFILPFVKVQNTEETPGNIPSPCQSPECEVTQDSNAETISDIEDVTASTLTATPNSSLPMKRKLTDVRSKNSTSGTQIVSKKKTNKGNLDSVFLEYFERKKEKTENARELFLRSLLPEVDKLTNIQFSVFRRKVLDALDDAATVNDNTRTNTPQSYASFGSSNQSSCTAQSMTPQFPQPELINPYSIANQGYQPPDVTQSPPPNFL